MFAFLAIVAIIGLVVTAAIYSYKKNQARIGALVSLAHSKGWQFAPHDPFGLPGRWGGAPFNAGYDRRAANVITGEHDGKPFVAFDYSYKEDSRDSEGKTTTRTYCFAIVALGMPCALPELHVGPEGVFSRIGRVMGMQDIELESEDFNRAFRVRCPNPKLATDILSPRTMEALLANGKIRFRMVGSDILAYENGNLDAVEVLRCAHVLSEVIDGVPQFVWRDYGLYDRPVTPSQGNAS
ncbi:MAG TPA: DUF3137 domain-containing protein [Frankiaceae bacterium]|nr:DUF3137 domain-containing protein [Frankiaceae bacterium]